MPLLARPDADVLGGVKMFTPTSPMDMAQAVSDKLGLGSGGSGPTVGQQRFDAQQQKEQRIAQLAQQYGDDYDALTKAVTAEFPEEGFRIGKAVEEYRQNAAKTDVENSTRAGAFIDLGSRMLQLASNDPKSYPTVHKMIAAASPQLAPFLPADDDPQLSDKLLGVIQHAQSTKNFLEWRAKAGDSYLDGKHDLAAAQILAGASTPQQRQAAESMLHLGGLDQFTQLFPDQATAQKYADDHAKDTAEKDPWKGWTGPAKTRAQLLLQNSGRDVNNPLALTQKEVDAIQKEGAQAIHITTAGAGGPVPTNLTDLAKQAGMTVDALKRAADVYHKTGDIQGFGMSGAASKKAIMNAESMLYPEGSDIALNKAGFKADQAALTALTKQYNAVQAYETTSLKNLKMFTDLAAKIPDTGIPWLNTPVRALSASLVGSENMAAINTARQVALTEIAKVVNNPNLSGALSDSARQEVMGLNPSNATLPQIKRVAAILQQDMANRSGSMAQQIKDLQYQMAHPGGTTPTPQLPAGPSQKIGRFTVTVGQ